MNSDITLYNLDLEQEQLILPLKKNAYATRTGNMVVFLFFQFILVDHLKLIVQFFNKQYISFQDHWITNGPGLR